MQYQTISVEPRKAAGKAAQEGKLPVVLSRKSEAALSLFASSADLSRAVRRSGVGGLIELEEEGGKKHLGILKELQWHPISRKLRHASFVEVQRDQVINATVPIVFVGEPQAIGAKAGQLIKHGEAIEVHAKVTDLPDHITLNIGGMEVGDVITAGDVPLPANCSALHPDTAVITLTTPTVEEIAVPSSEEDAVGNVEEIGKAKGDEDEAQS